MKPATLIKLQKAKEICGKYVPFNHSLPNSVNGAIKAAIKQFDYPLASYAILGDMPKVDKMLNNLSEMKNELRENGFQLPE